MDNLLLIAQRRKPIYSPPKLRSRQYVREDPRSMATDKTQQIIPSGGGAAELDESVDPQEYARLLDLYDNSFRNIAEGEVVKGTVLKVTPSEVIVDVGYTSEGIIPVDQFIDLNGH